MATGLVFGGERAVVLDAVGAAPWLSSDGSSGAGQWAGVGPWLAGEPHLARLAGEGLGLTGEDSPVLWVVGGRGVNRRADRYLPQGGPVVVGGEVFADQVAEADLASVVLLACPVSAVREHAGERERRGSQDRRAAAAAVAVVRREQVAVRGVGRPGHSCCAVAVRGPVVDADAVDLARLVPADIDSDVGPGADSDTGFDAGSGADCDASIDVRGADLAVSSSVGAPLALAENTEDGAEAAVRAGRLDRVGVAVWRAGLAGLPVGPQVAAQLAARPAAPLVVDVSPRAGGSDQFVWANALLDSITVRRQLINHLQALQARDEYDLERHYPGLVENLPFEVGAALQLTDHQAERELSVASSSHTRLPAAVAAWRTGRVCVDKVRTLTEQTLKLELGQARAVADRVLPAAPGQTVPAFRAAVRRAVLDIDPEGAERRHREAKGNRRVRKYVLEDGMAELRYTDAAQHVQLLWDVVNELGRAAKTPGDRRSADQRRADTLADVADAVARHGLRVSDSAEDPAGDNDSTNTSAAESPVSGTNVLGPIEVAARVVDPAGTEIATAINEVAEDAPASSSSSLSSGRRARRRKRVRPRVRVNVTMPITVLAGGVGTCELAGYGPITAGQAWTLAGDAELRRMLCDPVDGTLLAAGTARYRPPGWLREMVMARAVTCVAPGCALPAEYCDIDHREPWPQGATSTGNLDPLCRHHHRCKDGGGFTLTKDPDGTYRWRTPLGRVITRPPTRWLHPQSGDSPGTGTDSDTDSDTGSGTGTGSASHPGAPITTTVPTQQQPRPIRITDDDPPPF